MSEKPSTGDDRAPGEYVVALVREGKVVEAILASHIERCFLYGCAHPVGKTHCPYCGRFISALPPKGLSALAAVRAAGTHIPTCGCLDCQGKRA